MNIDTKQLKYVHSKLRRLLAWLERETGLTFTITSQYRSDDYGVHGTLPLRGTDLSCHVESIGRAIEKFVNANWEYDPQRPQFKCCRFHGPEAGNPWHLHMQVHPKTRKRKR